MSKNIKKVYFAGKVKPNGYRQELFGPDVMFDGCAKYDLDGGSLVYGGPFALNSGHGMEWRAGEHGLINRWGWTRDLVEYKFYSPGHVLNESYEGHGCFHDIKPMAAVERCLSQIIDCDAVHAYIESLSSYGTFAEVGFASAFGKPIYIFYEPTHDYIKHLWFLFNLPNIRHVGPGNPTSLHSDLLMKIKTHKERYHEYLLSEEWNERRKSKIREAGGRCQLCNAQQKLNVHHRTYERVFNELQTDLIALCDECHTKFHDALSDDRA